MRNGGQRLGRGIVALALGAGVAATSFVDAPPVAAANAKQSPLASATHNLWEENAYLQRIMRRQVELMTPFDAAVQQLGPGARKALHRLDDVTQVTWLSVTRYAASGVGQRVQRSAAAAADAVPSTETVGGVEITRTTSEDGTSGSGTAIIDGAKVTVGVDLGVPGGPGGGWQEVERNGKRVRTSWSGNLGSGSAPPCPQPDGTVDWSVPWNLSATVLVTDRSQVTAAETIRIRNDTDFHAIVGDDGYLSSVTANSALSYGIFRRSSSIEYTGTVATTVSPSSLRSGKPTVRVTSEAWGADVRLLWQLPLPDDVLPGIEREQAANFKKAWRDLAIKTVATNATALKASEDNWRTPNACVDLALDPSSGSGVAPGDTGTVDATLETKEHARVPATIDAAASVGEVTPSQGSTSETEPASFTWTAEDADPYVVVTTYTATSRAGIAQSTWFARREETTTGNFTMNGIGYQLTLTDDVTIDSAGTHWRVKNFVFASCPATSRQLKADVRMANGHLYVTFAGPRLISGGWWVGQPYPGEQCDLPERLVLAPICPQTGGDNATIAVAAPNWPAARVADLSCTSSLPSPFPCINPPVPNCVAETRVTGTITLPGQPPDLLAEP